MIGNTKISLHIILLYSFIALGCESFTISGGRVNLIIDPSESGWYFTELIQDPTIKPGKINVAFGSARQLRKIRVSRYEDYVFNVFDSLGSKISGQMMMPAYASHGPGRNFFEFYNPSKEDLQKMMRKDPTDPHYEEI